MLVVRRFLGLCPVGIEFDFRIDDILLLAEKGLPGVYRSGQTGQTVNLMA